MHSIRLKLIFWVCLLFVLIGGLIYIPLSIILPQKITLQILKRDVEIAKHLSKEVKKFLLLNNKVGLSLFLHDNLEEVGDAQYLFVQSPKGDIKSHTFVKGFPKGLMSFGSVSRNRYGIKDFLSNGMRIYDIAIPLLEGQLGTLHLGVSMGPHKKDIAEVTRINHYVAIVILLGLGAGILVFLGIGLLFSRQIIKLKNLAVDIGKGNLEAKSDIKSKDEIGTLATAFNEMASSLKAKIEEIKRLNTLEIRNRIAFDLHDDLAQDLANIIKRLELCGKLFRINSAEAFKELNILEENTRAVLNKTRQVISNLKSPEEADFDLFNKLKYYIDVYREQNNINVKLDTPALIKNVSSEKARIIFYIIVEAFANVKKHSEAKNIEIRIKINNDNLLINIKDDGKGFNVDKSLKNVSGHERLGLISMQQRVNFLKGVFLIKSKLGQGTRIIINVPLTEEMPR